MEKPRLVDLVVQRQLKESCAYYLTRKLQVTHDLIARLGLEKGLEGHGGCVNCLEWNETGQILASASDDTHVILWDPFRYKKKLVLRTGHSGNIFSVKFMPKSNDGILVTGAGDCCVRIHDVAVVSDTILECTCHTGRVKRIATASGIPFMFWTAGEDGLIMQYDTRIPHTCTTGSQKCILINLINHVGQFAEAKCIAVNPCKPELIAVGANDAFVRMYDRRMIKPTTGQGTPANSDAANDDSNESDVRARLQQAGKGDMDNNVPLGCAWYFIAGHLRARRHYKKRKSLTSTYLTFSADGNDLLINMGGEQIYLFDVNKGRSSRFTKNSTTDPSSAAPVDNQRYVDYRSQDGGHVETYFRDNDMPVLPPYTENIKQAANIAFQDQKYTSALNLYNKAIASCPRSAVLYANRAAALMKRAWDGDIYAALRDCQIATLLDPGHVKAQFRLARCLYDLNRVPEADEVIVSFEQKFPEFTMNSAFRALYKDIKKYMSSEESEITDEENDRTIPTTRDKGISHYEQYWRRRSADYEVRFCGHCNTTTDIKEANFFGSDGQYIMAGSDDGSFFIWDRETTNILRILRGDESVVNCLQPHPSSCLLATSGIDPVIRLWSPRPEDGSRNEREIENLEDAASANQARMNSNPFELMLMSVGYRFPDQQQSAGEDGDQQGNRGSPTPPCQPLNCRQS